MSDAAPQLFSPPLFSTVLVANRGEIAVRIFRTLRSLGIRSVAVYSDADVDARHVREADEAVRIGPESPARSYLDAAAILEAARRTGAQAIHPGYGFLSENAEFARAVVDAGLVFIGPPADAIDLMGDKIRAKTTVSAAGVPVVPGRAEPGLTDADLAEAADEIGYPVLLKPSAGGGGKGMRLVHDPADLLAEAAAARREASGAFGDDTLFIERFVLRPRHIEVQVFADAHGSVVAFGERECSLQRRHQKIVEEAPSPLLDDGQRSAMAEQAVAAARACGYRNAGTIEFIVSADRPEEFFFMEMNTRLQVEHPVTELVWGVDLVELQVRAAAGEPLPFTQAELSPRGHAVEARIYAEDPDHGFLPSSGPVLSLREPTGEGVRVDSSLLEGGVVGSTYDPMLSKIIAWAPDRATALTRLDRALADTSVLGLQTNTGFLRRLLDHPAVVDASLDTELVERELSALSRTTAPDGALAAGAIARSLLRLPSPEAVDGGVTDPWQLQGGWRVGDAAWTTSHEELDGEPVVLAVRGGAVGGRTNGRFEVRSEDGTVTTWSATLRDRTVELTSAAGRHRFSLAVDPATDALWLGSGGETWTFVPTDRDHGSGDGSAASDGAILSPMPGTVTAVLTAAGETVDIDQPIVVVEAMKMEHTLTAPIAGVLAQLPVSVGDKVALKALLAVIEPVDG